MLTAPTDHRLAQRASVGLPDVDGARLVHFAPVHRDPRTRGLQVPRDVQAQLGGPGS